MRTEVHRENVILVSRVTQRPGLPAGALEGLTEAALSLWF